MLVCLAHAGGNAGLYRGWAELLPSWVRVTALDYPGRRSRYREPECATMSELVSRLARDVEPFLGGRLAFFGHSMGAVVAFALIADLEARGAAGRIEHLFASAAGAPGSESMRPPLEHAKDAEVVAEMVLLGGTPVELLQDPDMVRWCARVLRTDETLLRRFHKTHDFTAIHVPVTVLRGDSDGAVLEASQRKWQWATTAGCAFQEFAGGHFYLIGQEASVTRLVVNTLVRSSPEGAR